MEIKGLSIQCTEEAEVWLYFSSGTGCSAGLNINALAEKQSPIIGRAIQDWVEERLQDGIREEKNGL